MPPETVRSLALVVLLIFDCYLQKPVLFVGLNSAEGRERDLKTRLGFSIVRDVDQHGMSRPNVRESSAAGAYVSAGVATIDNHDALSGR